MSVSKGNKGISSLMKLTVLDTWICLLHSFVSSRRGLAQLPSMFNARYTTKDEDAESSEDCSKCKKRLVHSRFTLK